MSRFTDLFPAPKPLIGMVALPPSIGYASFATIDGIITAALADLEALQLAGVDGVLVENDFDQPHTLIATSEVVASMSRVTTEVVRHAQVPVGVEVLLNDWRASLAVAAATGARFIRLDFFVDRVISKLGVIEPEPEAIFAFRQQIHAESVLIFADLQVKYSRPADGSKPIEQSACEAARAGADAVIVTGNETGIGPTVDDLRAARAGGLPVLIGSGLSPANVAQLAPEADGYIVGTALRSGPAATDRVVADRVKELVSRLRSL